MIYGNLNHAKRLLDWNKICWIHIKETSFSLCKKCLNVALQPMHDWRNSKVHENFIWAYSINTSLFLLYPPQKGSLHLSTAMTFLLISILGPHYIIIGFACLFMWLCLLSSCLLMLFLTIAVLTTLACHPTENWCLL